MSAETFFRVKPRLLTLLGDQLIRDANLAVFELVKNAYDADATTCVVTLSEPTSPSRGSIEIIDDGSGMDETVLRNAWMVIATDFRAAQRAATIRTPRFHRFPLGEKGLGRLSIHKLGRMITMTTRVKGGDELVMVFDWDELETAATLDAATVKLDRHKPTAFPGDRHGTKLKVSRLREEWSRGEVRKLYRAVNSLCSPFQGPADFSVSLSVPGHESWLEGLFEAESAREAALYRIHGLLEGDTVSLDYEFHPPVGLRSQISGRREEVRDFPLLQKTGRASSRLDLSKHEIGKIGFDFWLFDRDPSMMRAVTEDVKGLKDFLNENGGIRVYRDGIRVYDFGEPGNDWLNLDIRRVNTPTARTSNNQIIGALKLDAATSGALREKSNREGFIETPAYADFRAAVTSVLTQVEAEKTKDQRRLREVLKKGRGRNVFAAFAEVRETLAEKGYLKEVEAQLKAVEQEMELYRDQLLHAAVPGLTMGVMLHGAEKILDELREAAKRPATDRRIRDLVDRLYRAMRPVTSLLKDPGVAKTKASALVREALFATELRLRKHGVTLLTGLQPELDFQLRGSKQMLVASITNLIDNSIHWLETKGATDKRIYVGISRDKEVGGTIVVADNGPGFGNDLPEDLTTPFFTRRAGGMGLGLYIVSEVMRVNGGEVIFPAEGDVALPSELDGAVVALLFKEIE